MLIRRSVERFRDSRLIGAVVLLAAFVVIALFVPHPDAEQIRDWARAAGPWFPLMFGPVTGIAVAVSATTVSAALAFLLVRAIGRDAIAARLTYPAVAAVDRRLAPEPCPSPWPLPIGRGVSTGGGNHPPKPPSSGGGSLGIEEPAAEDPVGSSSQG